MRGKQCIITRQRREGRITPAGAGKTNRWTKLHKETVDHPRRCGENLLPLLRLWSPLGSPPQVRGKPRFAVHSVVYDGITPAGAGKTSWRRNKVETIQDHPRRCGENCMWGWYVSVTGGSPPQVRGKLQQAQRGWAYTWITPAGAGKTQSRRLTQPAKRDHPRRCGENCLGALVPAVGTGSPPQVRGKPMVILPIPS